VLVTGCGHSETLDGGYAEYARAQGDSVIPLPAGLSAFDAMALGTAGFTTGLAIHRMEQNGQKPSMGPIVVTGASGGVGSIAIDLLSKLGYEVVAVSGKPEADAHLKALGASRILRRQEIDLGKRPLETAQWGGAIDNVGGEILTWLTRTVDNWGNIASIGLAASHKLETTVMPFILRGVSLLGVNSTDCPTPEEGRAVWQRLATDMRPPMLKEMARTVPFADLPTVFDDFINAKVTRRVVVDLNA
jgi:NADPH2:quinone reductase